MKVALVIPSIQKLDNLRSFDLSHIEQVIVVDEGDEALRDYNAKILGDYEDPFFGPKERAQCMDKDVSVIPKRCHAETSFGFYHAYHCGAEVVIELDDDCWKDKFGMDLVGQHIANLGPMKAHYINSSRGGWYNPLVKMNYRTDIFPRGYPYDWETRVFGTAGWENSEPTVLNMGLWSGQPDLDAATILSLGGLRGLAGQDPEAALLERKTIIGKGIFFPICSMNTSFRAEIIPAFYQMYMNYEGLDRYCDIWSGLFIKKICDHLGKNVSLGQPVVEHRKTERSTFKDLRAEHEGMAINETLWKVVRDMELKGKTYIESYASLIQQLSNDVVAGAFPDKLHQKMLGKQVYMMEEWLGLFE